MKKQKQISVTRKDYENLIAKYKELVNDHAEETTEFTFRYENADKDKIFTLKQAKAAIELYQMVYDLETHDRPAHISVLI